MTGLAVVLSVLAVLLAVRPTPVVALDLPPATASAGGGRWPRWLPPAAGAAAATGILGLALVLGGPLAAVSSLAGLLVVGTVARLLGLRRRRLASARRRLAVAEAAGALAANLRVGMVPVQALTAASASCPVLAEARETLAIGGNVVAVWRRQAEQDGGEGFGDLARAWQVASTSGASLTATLEQVAVGLAADTALRAVVGSELAAPRATGKLMAALPGLGIGLGYLIGGEPLRWLSAGPAGWACLVLGVLLACAGVLWIEGLARRAGTHV